MFSRRKRSESHPEDASGAEAGERPRIKRASDIGTGPKLRLVIIACGFCAAFILVAVRTAAVSWSDPVEPRLAARSSEVFSQRIDLVDRNGVLLATNLPGHSLYVMGDELRRHGNPEHAAATLAAIFPNLDENELFKRFTGAQRFIWIKRKISPEQAAAVRDVGEPGLYLGPREVRVYPNGSLAAHVLGGTTFGIEGVQAAEVKGVAGVELHQDDYLSDPENGGRVLGLSLDARAQAVVEKVLGDGMRFMNALGGSAFIMDVDTGEILALASLPDFDPNDRNASSKDAKTGLDPKFNQAAQGTYELGSTFKPFAAAQAIELGLVNENTVLDTRPFKIGKYTFEDMYPRNSRSVTEIVVKSSNVGSAKLAQMIGPERQKDFLGSLGLLKRTGLELNEARHANPSWPSRWKQIASVTVSYGHGIAVSPIHLGSAYAALVNGGTTVEPTILKRSGVVSRGQRVISEDTSEAMRRILRDVVKEGTATIANIGGYSIGGKTGTADKPDPRGGYSDERVLATFASFFPSENPRYVLVVTLDEPSFDDGEEVRRTAGWTAVPVAVEIVSRVAPILDVLPGAGVL